MPGSKSIAQRALVAASLGGGATRISGLPDGEDVASCAKLIEDAGATVERLAPAALRIIGRPPGLQRGLAPNAPLELGESGTLARFAIASLAFCARAGTTIELAAGGSLRRRSTPALVRALADAGVEFERRDWPLRFRAIGPPSDLELVDPSSSQEVSALLIALAAYPDEIRLTVKGAIPSRPYVELTRAVLSRFGVMIASEPSARGELFRVRGPIVAPHDPLEIEPDASLAAVALAAACLSGGELVASGLHASSAQGDVRIAEHLRAFGCVTRFTPGGLAASERPTKGATLDLSGEPDLAPVLAIVAAGAVVANRSAKTTLLGLDTLPGKESSRIDVLADGLSRAGFGVSSDSRSLSIFSSPKQSSGPLELDPANDHRMAFAFALLGLVRDGVSVRDPECVAKSWPNFWRDLERLGARSHTS